MVVFQAEAKRRQAERERRDVERNADAIRARCQTFIGFVREAWHVLEPNARYVHSWHIDAICDHLEAVTGGRITRLLINVPPGSMKSLLVSVLWQAWEWGPRGMCSMRFLSTAFNDGPVTRDCRKCRDLILSEWYRALWPEVVLTRTAEMSFANSDTGSREGVAFGSLTSQRADRLIIDDPHSVETAESKAERDATTRKFREGALNRLNDQDRSAIVVIMQRLHEEDVSGIILSHGMDYVHLCLPMEFEEPRCETEIGFVDPRDYDGELLAPERFSPDAVAKLKRDLTQYAYAGQYQQRPSPRGGGILPRAGWEYWDKALASKYGRNENQFPDFEYIVASADTAYTEKTERDFSALVVLGIWHDLYRRPKVMVMMVWQKRLALNDLVNEIIRTCRKYKVDRLLIEAKASGISVAQETRRLMGEETWAVQLVNPGAQDKTARAYSVQHLLGEEIPGAPRRDGIVYVPCVTNDAGAMFPRQWAEMLITQCETFPKGAHDDMVDGLVNGLRHLRDTGMARRSDEMIADEGRALLEPIGQSKSLYPQ